MTAAQFLRKVHLFQSLSVEDSEKLAANLKHRSVKKGEILFRKGDEGSTLYIIRKGTFKIVLPSIMGNEVSPAVLTEGDFFGEMALLDGMPRSADAVALEPSQLFVLSRSDFLAFLRSNEEAIRAVLSSLLMRLRKTDDLLEDAYCHPVSTRFAKRLVELAKVYGRKAEGQEGDTIEIKLNLTQRDLASIVGTTRESINKELKILRKKGLINMMGNCIQILNLARLEKRARL